MAGMDDDKPKQRSGCALGFTVLVAVLPVLYVLSVGPVVWLSVHDWVPENVLGVLYWPLDQLCRWSPTINGMVSWYVAFCCGIDLP